MNVLYVLVEDIKNDLKLFNNTHGFEPNVSAIQQFSYRPLRLDKGFSKIFGSKRECC